MWSMTNEVLLCICLPDNQVTYLRHPYSNLEITNKEMHKKNKNPQPEIHYDTYGRCIKFVTLESFKYKDYLA